MATRESRRDEYRNEIRALLIEMRRHVLCHGILIGECVAWDKLKELHGVGQDTEADAAWLRQYQEKGGDLSTQRNG